MTATLAPFGFRLARRKGSSTNSTGVNRYRMAPGGTNANVFSGDAVKLATGLITPIVTTTDFAVGVFQGVYYNDPVSKQPRWSQYYAANTSVGTDPAGIMALVMDDPGATMLIQADASVTIGDIGLNFDVTLSAGSTFTGESGFALKAGSRTAASAMVRVVDFWETPDNQGSPNDVSTPFPIVEVAWVQNSQSRVSAG